MVQSLTSSLHRHSRFRLDSDSHYGRITGLRIAAAPRYARKIGRA